MWLNVNSGEEGTNSIDQNEQDIVMKLTIKMSYIFEATDFDSNEWDKS